MVERNNGYLSADLHMPYREKYQLLIPELIYGEELEPNTEIGFVLNRNLRSNALGLKEADKTFMGDGGVIPPGKSAHVIFPATAEEFVQIVLGRPYKPERDHIFGLKAGELNDLGFYALWAPLERCLLHVRVVHASAYDIEDAEQYQVSLLAREALVARLLEKSPAIF